MRNRRPSSGRITSRPSETRSRIRERWADRLLELQFFPLQSSYFPAAFGYGTTSFLAGSFLRPDYRFSLEWIYWRPPVDRLKEDHWNPSVRRPTRLPTPRHPTSSCTTPAAAPASNRRANWTWCRRIRAALQDPTGVNVHPIPIKFKFQEGGQ